MSSNSATDSIQLYLNSGYADTKVNNDTSICIYSFPQITIPDGHYIYLSLQNAVIPYSFYSINDNNNVLQILRNSITTTITIETGNYNINQMITALKAQLGGTYTITYNVLKNKITIVNSTNEFTILSTGTLNHALGFSTSINTVSVSRTVTSESCINLNSIRAINIEIDMPTYNINVAQKLNQNILATIPVVAQPFGMINYTNNNNFRINMFMDKMESIKIKLLDNMNNLLNMNNVNYQMTLQIDIVQFT